MDEMEHTKGQCMVLMLNEIMKDPGRTHTQIANKLGIKKWDYTRYFNELCSVVPLRYDVDSENLKKKRYYLDLEFKGNYLKSPDEFYQFIVASQIMSQGKIGDSGKILAHLKNAPLVMENFKNLSKQMVFLSLPESFVNIVEKLSVINEAIFAGRKVRFEYTRGEKVLPDVVVAPYKLISDRYWYLLGRSDYNGEQRYYKLIRMSNIEILKDQTFMMPTEDRIDIKRISVPWDFGDLPEQTVEFEIDRNIAFRLREDPAHVTQEITDLENGKSLLKMRVRNPVNMTSWIFSMGTMIKVLGPECLKTAVINELQKMQSVIV